MVLETLQCFKKQYSGCLKKGGVQRNKIPAAGKNR